MRPSSVPRSLRGMKLFNTPKQLTGALVLIATALVAQGCGDGDQPVKAADSSPLPQGSKPFPLDPADFTTQIDNPYLPMAPGDRRVYRETHGDGSVQKVVVTVSDKTKRIANGIEARVVHDQVTERGALVEDTYDWYAQDAAGNVWYLGESTKEYKNGKVSTTAGSWEAGVDGAQAGVVMPARPQAGQEYRQEYYAGEAEDAAKILSTDEIAEVPAGNYKRVVLTKDFTPLQPRILEYKLYVPGVGLVLALGISDGDAREELLNFTRGR